jgi:hypothetical protein
VSKIGSGRGELQERTVLILSNPSSKESGLSVCRRRNKRDQDRTEMKGSWNRREEGEIKESVKK